MAGCVMMALANLGMLDMEGRVLRSPLPPVSEMENKLGHDRTAQLIHHAVAEQIRYLMDNWEVGEMVLALALGTCLYFATQRRIFPLVLCGVMLILTTFQHGAVSTELAFRGRDTDFPPGSLDANLITRMWALRQVYYGVEVLKVLTGGVLASYLFVFRTSRRASSQKEHAHAAQTGD